MFNTAGVTDEENAPTAVVSEEVGGESEHCETEHKPFEALHNSGKEQGFSFLDMDFFAFNLIYLGQYLSLEVTKNISVFGMVLTN